MDYKCVKKCLKALVLSCVIASHFPSVKADFLDGRTTDDDNLQEIYTLQKAFHSAMSDLKARLKSH